MAILRLDHVQLAAPAGCEPEARRFFGELLGLEEIEKPEPLLGRGGAWFALASGQQLHVGVEDPFAPARQAHPALAAASAGDGLDQLAGDLSAAGFPVTWDDSLPGQRRFFTEDPWGNRIELLAER